MDLTRQYFPHVSIQMKTSVEGKNQTIAVLQYLNGNIKSAEKSFNKVLKIDKDNLAAKVVLTQIQLKSGRLTEALKWAEKIKKEHKKSSKIDKIIAMGNKLHGN